MASRTPKNDEQLAQGAPHLVYEVQMLGALTEYIKTKAIDARVRDMPQDGLPARNAILESFAVHARVLLGFLYPDDGLIKDADVLARDYFGSGAWKPSAKTKALETVRGRVGTEVAHLSYKRNHQACPRTFATGTWGAYATTSLSVSANSPAARIV